MEVKFYKCNYCGNLVMKLKDSGNKLSCCGHEMELIEVQSDEDTFGEKHVPVFEIEGHKICVKIGSEPHPHTADHHIEWICLQTKNGFSIKYLTPEEEPEAHFRMCKDDEIKKIYAYCNIHGLWVCDCNCDKKECKKDQEE